MCPFLGIGLGSGVDIVFDGEGAYRCSDNRCSDNRYSDNRCSDNRCSDNRYSDNRAVGYRPN